MRIALLVLILTTTAEAKPRTEPLRWFGEVGGGVSLCGARGKISCDTAGTGAALDLRVGRQFDFPLTISWATSAISLPAEGVDGGALWIHGPEVAGRLTASDALHFEGALRVGFHHVAGVYGSGYGVGTAELRVGARYLAWGRWRLGLDYGLTRPARTHSCLGDRCADVDLALLHRLGLVVGVLFW